MIKREVLHRAQVKTVYSSERQQRMKVYFELNQQYNQCLQPCKFQPTVVQQQCKNNCQKIFDKYAEQLKDRYIDNKERLDMQVKNSQIFTKRKRQDRNGWFYDLFGVGFGQMMGYTKPPVVNMQQQKL